MKQSGKHVENARKKVEARPYKLAEGTELIKKTHHTKFNETVELAINLGVDPKHSDQVVRGTVVLPNGLGKAVDAHTSYQLSAISYQLPASEVRV